MGTQTKEERKAKKQDRKAARGNILAILAALKGKKIKAMSAKEKEDLLIVLCDIVGVSENGTVK